MSRGDLAAFLGEHSNLPGPRGNLELADAFAVAASRETILAFADEDDEYLRFCGTQGLGRLLVEAADPAAAAGDAGDTRAALLATLVERASDPLWRVREASARALQIVGDSDPGLLYPIMADWVADPEAYVRRAAVAAICEPRLLTTPRGFRVGLEACEAGTASLVALSPAERAQPGPRNLRQGLGYGWSVVVAANPAEGMPAFDRLRASDDPDVRWIVSENLKKNRLKRLLSS
jgi:hypothetical protein